MALPIFRPANPATLDRLNSSVFHRDLHAPPLKVVSADGCWLTIDDGRKIFDATSGAAVACVGHGNEKVRNDIKAQLDQVAYVHSLLYATSATEELAEEMINGTGGKMERVFLVSSGSEATEAALKMARQYFLELPTPEPERIHFISRRQSYHGITIGALSLSGHIARRRSFEPLLAKNMSQVSPCNPYRGMLSNETTGDYVQRLKDELEAEFQRVGPGKVAAFVAETVVGAALGCVPPVPGYFQAMKSVCDAHGALLILDEVMSGMGRCGTLHAWENEGIVPDIQTVGKGLGGGYAPIAGLLVNKRVVDIFKQGTGSFTHGQTYQAHPLSCAAALSVQRLIRTENLLSNAAAMGEYLSTCLITALSSHPHVGDIRGRGMFWGIEFVADKVSKEPFELSLNVAMRVHSKGMEEGISLYPGTGTADGIRGDHVLLAPMYTVTQQECDFMVEKVVLVITAVFAALEF
ncbi:hypothetical protein RUND412_005319 [Rhizina undulata]